MSTAKKIHQFELQGLGQAPFALVGFYQMPSPSMAEANPMAYQSQLQAMPKGVACGSCHYCSTPLTNNFIIQSSDNKLSVVGCDCVKKVGDRGLVDAVKAMQAQSRREKKQAEREALYESKMAEQRKQNGGLTNAEMAEQAQKARDDAFEEGKHEIRDTLRDFGRAMNSTKGDFAYRANMLLRDVNFNEISPNMGNIIVEITAKVITGARKGSKAYKAKHAELKPVMDAARESHDALYQRIYG